MVRCEVEAGRAGLRSGVSPRQREPRRLCGLVVTRRGRWGREESPLQWLVCEGWGKKEHVWGLKVRSKRLEHPLLWDLAMA